MGHMQSLRVLLFCVLAGGLSAGGGVLAALLIGALLVELNCLADPGGGMIVVLLIIFLAVIGGLYGFLHAKLKLQGQRDQISKARQFLILFCLAAVGGFLFLNGLVLMATLNFRGGNSPTTVLLVIKLLLVSFLFFAAFYWVMNRKTSQPGL